MEGLAEARLKVFSCRKVWGITCSSVESFLVFTSKFGVLDEFVQMLHLYFCSQVMLRRKRLNLVIKRDFKERIWKKSDQFSDVNLLRRSAVRVGSHLPRSSPHPESRMISAGLLFVPSKPLWWKKLDLVVFCRTIIRLFKNLQTIVRLWTKNSGKSRRENRKREVNLIKKVCFSL